MRVVRVLEPVRTKLLAPDIVMDTGYERAPSAIVPREGELLSFLSHRCPRLWAIDIDKSALTRLSGGLETLFENQRIYGDWQPTLP